MDKNLVPVSWCMQGYRGKNTGHHQVWKRADTLVRIWGEQALGVHWRVNKPGLCGQGAGVGFRVRGLASC